MRAAFQILGALLMAAGAGVLLLMARYVVVLSAFKAAVPATVWAWHFVVGALLFIGGVLLLGRSRPLP